MSAEKALFAAYQEWHRLSVAAGRAIQRRNWDFLRERQLVIEKLQPLISRLTLEARGEWARLGTDMTAKEDKIRAAVSDLVELGQRNRVWLRAARETAQSERERLEQAGQNLKRVQQSYASSRSTGWTSFS